MVKVSRTAGRLKKSYHTQKGITINYSILNAIKGYKILFKVALYQRYPPIIRAPSSEEIISQQDQIKSLQVGGYSGKKQFITPEYVRDLCLQSKNYLRLRFKSIMYPFTFLPFGLINHLVVEKLFSKIIYFYHCYNGCHEQNKAIEL